jgi:hypothetical protein
VNIRHINGEHGGETASLGHVSSPNLRANALTVLAISLHRVGEADNAVECLRQAFKAE